MTHIPDKIFHEMIDIVYRESGIVLHDKRELLEARLASLSRKKGYSSPKEILERLTADQTGEALIEFLDQVSTNLTYFFREPAHFDFVSKVLLPGLLARKKARREKRIRFWCAACSSGEEPYSLAMITRDYIGDHGQWDIKILGTDISTRMLNKAIRGSYTRQEVMKVPATLIQKYFHRTGDRNKAEYHVRNEIKNMVTIRRLNLLQENYPFQGRFDLILCRNVMIYFDTKTKQALLARFHRYLDDGGYMFTGHAESLSGHEHLFKRIQVAVYQK